MGIGGNSAGWHCHRSAFRQKRVNHPSDTGLQKQRVLKNFSGPLARATAASSAFGMLHSTAFFLIYHFVIVLPPGAISPWLLLGAPLAPWCTLIGFGIGRSVGSYESKEGSVPESVRPTRKGRLSYFIGPAVVALVGFLAAPSFIKNGAEAGATNFGSGNAILLDDAGQSTTALNPGNYALYGYSGGDAKCRVLNAAGGTTAISAPAIEVTDRSDGAPNSFLGVFRVALPGRVAVQCNDDVGGLYISRPPTIRGAAGKLIMQPLPALWAIGLLPGAVVLSTAMRRQSRSFKRRGPHADAAASADAD